MKNIDLFLMLYTDTYTRDNVQLQFQNQTVHTYLAMFQLRLFKKLEKCAFVRDCKYLGMFIYACLRN